MSEMIPNPEVYFKQFTPSGDSLLSEIEKDAWEKEIPIIGPVVGEMLYILAVAVKAKRILELGTATGYSAIYLAKACEISDGQVVTVERVRNSADKAMSNLKKACLAHRAEIRVGDALEVMSSIKEPFDFIFLDIDKEYYLGVLSQCQRLLKSGGLLVADNVGFKDSDDFNRAVFDMPEWRTVHLLSFLPFHSPENDGLCLALRV
ncbi:MAG: O-methyltransferase [Desulfobacterales bacterium]|nr:O-methyltransferase [Desulfobacterales bacterium]